MAVGRDLRNRIKATVAIAPDGNRTNGAVTSGAIGLAGYDTCTVLCVWGTVTDGTFTPSVTSSTTSGGSYNAESNTLGTLTAGAAGTSNTVTKFDIDAQKALPFVKVTVTGAGTTTGGKYGVIVIQSRAASEPVA